MKRFVEGADRARTGDALLGRRRAPRLPLARQEFVLATGEHHSAPHLRLRRVRADVRYGIVILHV
ncbi:hypothetical protein [Falsiroseomonas sp. HW251]|uniref:hypothetical protein n=1 Tax=Falsiroseomonas sp. HW251 TaxID=3390998 RepID=UPI003D31E94F